MKKSIISLILGLFLLTGTVYAEAFDKLEGLSAVQQQKLSQIQFNFKQKNAEIEKKLSEYQDKLNQLKEDKTKTQEQINLLAASYERNISVFKAQKEALKKETDALYKSVMTQEQFLQYQAQQIQVNKAFSDFLKK